MQVAQLQLQRHFGDALHASLVPLHLSMTSHVKSQGVNEDLQPQLHQSIAYSAARYGHVMHPENASEPVVACAEALLGSVGKGWAQRVFFSADGCAHAST